jgi:hypothetical protein
MNTENADRDPPLKEDDSRWGMIVLLAAVLGIPVAAIVVNVLRK